MVKLLENTRVFGRWGSRKATRTTDDSRPLQFGLSGFICRTEKFAEKIWQSLTYLSYSFVIYLLATDSFTGMTWNDTLLARVGIYLNTVMSYNPRMCQFFPPSRAEPAFDGLGGTILRRLWWSPWWLSRGSPSFQMEASGGTAERLRSSVAFIRAITPRSQLIGGRLVHFNKANELPVTIIIQHSLPGILFI